MRSKDAPELSEFVEPESWFYWQAYHHLSGSRSGGLDVGSIPFSEIMHYAEFAGIKCPVEKNRLVRFIMAMDKSEVENGRTEITA